MTPVFLSTSATVVGGQDYSLASKTFDYLRFGKPILGFVTEGVQKEFLQRSGFGWIVDPDDEAASEKLEQLLGNAGVQATDKAYLRQFQRQHTTKQLATIFQKLSSLSD